MQWTGIVMVDFVYTKHQSIACITFIRHAKLVSNVTPQKSINQSIDQSPSSSLSIHDGNDDDGTRPELTLVCVCLKK